MHGASCALHNKKVRDRFRWRRGGDARKAPRMDFFTGINHRIADIFSRMQARFKASEREAPAYGSMRIYIFRFLSVLHEAIVPAEEKHRLTPGYVHSAR